MIFLILIFFRKPNEIFSLYEGNQKFMIYNDSTLNIK